ncbi:uncharacterized protein ImpH/VasB [Vibrio astriarenae]|nr:uncharacterized protein ImpH/VasB [Vibrio sp. C7]
MGNVDRDTTVDLMKPINESISSSSREYPQDAHAYQFFQLIELTKRIDGETDTPSHRWLFSANPSLGFAASDVAGLRPLTYGRWEMSTRFLGLSGAQSPLPGFMLERLVTESEEGIKRPFFDFFNHRVLELFSELWRKYRYYLQFEPDAMDRMSNQFFALVGLGDTNLRTQTPINWCKMLSYAGTLAGRSRSPQVVAGIIAHCFDLEHVNIRQWEKRWVSIVDEQLCGLGTKNISLGENSVIGDMAVDVSGKFTICIHGLSSSRFEDFLPSGKEFLPLCTLVEFILREQLAYDLKLYLEQPEAMQMSLMSGHNVKLGWSSFLGKPQEDKHVLIQVRQ